MTRHLLTLVLTAALAACGGGGSDSPSPAQAQPSAPTCAAVTVALFGDSTLAGADGATAGQTVVADRPAAILQRQLDARLGVGVAKVVDRAVSGTDLGQLLEGVDGKNQAWPQPLVETGARLAVINHGVNDMGHGATLDAYRQRLQLAVSGAQAAGVRLIFQTPVQQSAGGVYGSARRVDAIKGYAATMRDVAALNGLTVADAAALQGETPDGVHPTACTRRRRSTPRSIPARSLTRSRKKFQPSIAGDLMPKFSVTIDRGEPYVIEAESSIDATIASVEQHPEAQRVDVRPMCKVLTLRHYQRMAAEATKGAAACGN